MAGKFYAVKKGRMPGIYNSWDDCKKQIDGFSRAVYKSFFTVEEAVDFIGWSKKSLDDNNVDKFDINSDNVAYVDGSYNNATREFSYGMVIFHNGEERRFCQKFCNYTLASMRNVAGEIKGAEAAMDYACKNGMKTLIICYDYEGIAKWPLREWKANKEGTKAYQKFYDNVKEYVDIKFVKVKGHSGNKYNDVADMLAKKALGI